MFEIGGYVSYRAEGICKITDIRKEYFGSVGSGEEYYILTPLNDPKSTVFVPIANEKLVGMMRKLLSPREIQALVEELREKRLPWISDSRARNNQYREILSLGDRKDLILLIHSVCDYRNEMTAAGKKPNSTDENACKRAVKMLFDEFSATTDLVSEEDILSLLKGTLEVKERQTI